MNPEPKRPVKLNTFTEVVSTGCGKAYITCSVYKPDEYFEIAGTLGKSGNCAAAQMDGLSRLINHYLNSGGDPKKVMRSLRDIQCPQNSKFLKSCAQALAFVLAEAVSLGKGEKT
jgi:ribonucleoside-diphosphate reductase alpha chain